MSSSLLLLIDTAINSLLGVLLMITIHYPDQIQCTLGVPTVGQPSYANLFGAVLISIK